MPIMWTENKIKIMGIIHIIIWIILVLCCFVCWKLWQMGQREAPLMKSFAVVLQAMREEELLIVYQQAETTDLREKVIAEFCRRGYLNSEINKLLDINL